MTVFLSIRGTIIIAKIVGGDFANKLIINFLRRQTNFYYRRE